MATQPNFAELDRVMNFIEQHPKKHAQETWGVSNSRSACGTAACFAGWTALLNGHTIDERNVFYDAAGKYAHPSDSAPEMLGLTYEQADLLFNGDNSRPRIRRIIDSWKEEYNYQEPLVSFDDKPKPVDTIDIEELLDDQPQEMIPVPLP